MTSHSLKPLAKCLIFKDSTTGWWSQDVLPLFSPVISHHQSLHCHKYLVWNLLTLKHKQRFSGFSFSKPPIDIRWYLSNYIPYPDPLLSCATVPSSDKFVNLDELSAGGKDWIWYVYHCCCNCSHQSATDTATATTDAHAKLLAEHAESSCRDPNIFSDLFELLINGRKRRWVVARLLGLRLSAGAQVKVDGKPSPRKIKY